VKRIGGFDCSEDQQKPGAAKRRDAGQINGVGHEQRQPKKVRVGLADVDGAVGNKRIHKPAQLELANPIII